MTLNLVPPERSCHKVYSCKYEGPNSYLLKDKTNVKAFAEKQTDRPKSLCPRSIDAGEGGGIENIRFGTRITNLLQSYKLQGKQLFVSYFSRLLRHAIEKGRGPILIT